MSDKKIIAVVGMCGSGKSEAVKYFVNRGFKKVYFGDVVIKELKFRELEINEVNERKIREELRALYGMGVMAIKSLDTIKEYFNTSNVVIESMYSWEEFKIIKNAFGNAFKLLAIYT
ncbi:MAG: dephospho-CoA kinase, partial [Ignavibacteriae bacterium]|nr:dephospho-CoA kinase [Ignavibacteriota bacterium]